MAGLLDPLFYWSIIEVFTMWFMTVLVVLLILTMILSLSIYVTNNSHPNHPR